ncbi:MAG: hypothetical protein DME00_25415 [Candidatus Rokuibacteriota bacterium]|nr:MAG: hypothetical protein DME00_25415 [Candidatus Rokubacteria bacterium]
MALYRPSGGPLSLEPRAPSSCRLGQSRRKPPGALRSRVLWSASSWPSCVGRLAFVSPVTLAFAGDDTLLLREGRTVISRRRFITGVVLAVTHLGATASAQEYKAQQAGKVPRIGFLANVRSPATEGFQQGLRELGYVEGQNIIVEWRFAEGQVERLPGLAAELVRLQVDIIVAPNPFYVEPARHATKTIPIVFALVSDPVGAGFVQSLARPGGNITGLSNISNELAAKRLELLKEALPRVNRVAFLTDSRVLGATPFRETEIAARALQVQLEVFTVRDARDAKEMDNAFDSMAKRGARGVIESGTPAFYAQRREIAALALKNRLPLMSAWGESPEAGGFMSYSASLPDLMRRSVAYVDKILKGAKPGDLPVEQPTKFELVINLKTAKALGLTIPLSVLGRADHVIE